MIILQGITVEDLLQRIEAIVEKKIEEKIKVEKPVQMMTRKEVAAYFKVSVVTVYTWTKEGLLPSYRIGRKVFYRSNEIEDAAKGFRKFRRYF